MLVKKCLKHMLTVVVCNTLYESDGAYTFMDNETYDQVELNLEQLGDAKTPS